MGRVSMINPEELGTRYHQQLDANKLKWEQFFTSYEIYKNERIAENPQLIDILSFRQWLVLSVKPVRFQLKHNV